LTKIRNIFSLINQTSLWTPGSPYKPAFLNVLLSSRWLRKIMYLFQISADPHITDVTRALKQTCCVKLEMFQEFPQLWIHPIFTWET